MREEKNSSNGRPRGGGAPALFAGTGFLLLAAWFLYGTDPATVPEARSARVNPAVLVPGPRRTPLGDPPQVKLAGFTYTCMDCHRLFPPRSDPPQPLRQHRHIVMEHGINHQCRNCHDLEDRDRLVLQGGASIPYDEVVRLCAECHGPVYRDWQRGMHGRTNGYWDPRRGPRHRLGCTECHDPHHPRHPAMDPVAPLPPPHTLRMPPPVPEHEKAPAEERDPLRRAILRSERLAVQRRTEEEF